jgi:hypothetical protein
MTVHAIAEVTDAYEPNPDTRNSMSIRGGFPYDSRMLTYYFDNGEVCILTLGGRERIPFTMGKHPRRMMENQQVESPLADRDGAMYLLATCNVVEPVPEDVNEAFGVGVGIDNRATNAPAKSTAVRLSTQSASDMKSAVPSCSRSARAAPNAASKSVRAGRRDFNTR